MNRFPLFVALAAVSTPLVSAPVSANSTAKKPAAKTPVAKKQQAAKTVAQKAAAKPAASQRYLPLAELKKLQAQRAHDPKAQALPVLQPMLDGKSLKGRDMKDLATNPPVVMVHAKVAEVEAGLSAGASGMAGNGMDGERFAQAFPPTVAPAAVRRTPVRPVTPKWVRYPLEFQLAGIGLGTKAVDKDRFNRIDRYGLFAMHGNPTAIVVPNVGGGTITVNQTPPEVAGMFPSTGPNGGTPDWAAAVTVQLDNNHVQWLYQRETYSMGFVVDRLGYVDAIVVAGISSPIARTQLEDPVHTIKLSDDLRKVLFRYGYPDTIETYPINAIGTAGPGDTPVTAAAGAGATTGAEVAAAETARTGNPQQGAAAGAAAGTEAGVAAGAIDGNSLFRTFEIRYEQSYNVVFTIRNNRVVRIYIFGDPDFFNEQRRNALRTSY